ncbi:MAG: AMP-binding protein [Actinomycetota bacterium]|nr:AMP-binding protein [Actinomycetota bacterium]
MWPGHHAQEHPDRIAQIMAGSGATLTYGELDARSNQLAHYFQRAGLGFDDHVAFFLENHPRYLEILWAAQRSGLRFTAISSRLTADEVEYLLDDCGAQVLITSMTLADVAGELRGRSPGVTTRLMLDGAIDGYDAYEPLVADCPTTPIDEELEGAAMLYSSGTTGRPKGIRYHLERQAVGSAPISVEMMKAVYGLDESDVFLSPAPMYHSAPLQFAIMLTRIGATVVVMEHFDAEGALAAIERYRVTHGQYVPTMFVRMLKLPDEVRTSYDVSTLRGAIHAAAPCPVPVKQKMIEWWGPILIEYYAATEGSGATLITSQEWLEHKGSVGKSLLGPAHILDDDGNELPPGEPGRVFFEAGGGMSFEYHNDPEKTAASRSPEGWTTVGDIGYLDDDGYLYLTDRAANMVISGGVNIYPQEAENVLITHPKVLDGAVFGIPDEEMGEQVKAVVQPLDWADAGPELERELLAFCRDNLAHYKCPRSIDFERELPRHETGKLYKRLLKDRYWGDRESRIV